MVPWYAEPLFAVIVDTPHRKHHRRKRFPRYECELTDYPPKASPSRAGECPLSAANHFCVQFTEEYECDPGLFRKALFIETAASSQEGLRKAFLEDDPDCKRTRIVQSDWIADQNGGHRLTTQTGNSSFGRPWRYRAFSC